MSKIQKGHLDRAAYVYVRQSTPGQVEHNLESQRRQYGLVERAKELGWQDVRVIDEDLGRSGSGRVERRGFETLLSEVCQGKPALSLLSRHPGSHATAMTGTGFWSFARSWIR